MFTTVTMFLILPTGSSCMRVPTYGFMRVLTYQEDDHRLLYVKCGRAYKEHIFLWFRKPVHDSIVPGLTGPKLEKEPQITSK